MKMQNVTLVLKKTLLMFLKEKSLSTRSHEIFRVPVARNDRRIAAFGNY